MVSPARKVATALSHAKSAFKNEFPSATFMSRHRATIHDEGVAVVGHWGGGARVSADKRVAHVGRSEKVERLGLRRFSAQSGSAGRALRDLYTSLGFLRLVQTSPERKETKATKCELNLTGV